MIRVLAFLILATPVLAQPPLISALESRGAQVREIGSAGGLDGYYVDLGNGNAYSLYLTDDGHAVAGLLYAPDGGLVTSRQLAGLAVPADAPPPREAAHLAHAAPARQAPVEAGLFGRSLDAFGFTLGRAGPQILLFADPECPYSRSAVASLGRHALSRGRFRLHVVPVGVLGAASARRAIAIASSPDPALAWFGHDVADVHPAGGRWIDENNALYDEWDENVVPLLAWRTPEGRVERRLGDFETEKDLDEWLRALEGRP